MRASQPEERRSPNWSKFRQVFCEAHFQEKSQEQSSSVCPSVQPPLEETDSDRKERTLLHGLKTKFPFTWSKTFHHRGKQQQLVFSLFRTCGFLPGFLVKSQDHYRSSRESTFFNFFFGGFEARSGSKNRPLGQFSPSLAVVLWQAYWRILLLCIYIPSPLTKSFDLFGRRMGCFKRPWAGIELELHSPSWPFSEPRLVFRAPYPLDQRSFPGC